MNTAHALIWSTDFTIIYHFNSAHAGHGIAVLTLMNVIVATCNCMQLAAPGVKPSHHSLAGTRITSLIALISMRYTILCRLNF